MLGWLDFFAVLATCTTVVVCFLIRAGHGTDVEEIAEELEKLGDLKTKHENLEKTVATNALQLKRLIDSKTNAALAAAFGGKG